jgi:hypothetical protein
LLGTRQAALQLRAGNMIHNGDYWSHWEKGMKDGKELMED